MENSHATFESYWFQEQQQTEENKKCIENTHLYEEHETNQIEEEHKLLGTSLKQLHEEYETNQLEEELILSGT